MPRYVIPLELLHLDQWCTHLFEEKDKLLDGYIVKSDHFNLLPMILSEQR